jgi:hypothetical protein
MVAGRLKTPALIFHALKMSNRLLLSRNGQKGHRGKQGPQMMSNYLGSGISGFFFKKSFHMFDQIFG